MSGGSKTGSASGGLDRLADLVPASGRLFDRINDRAALSRFLTDRTRRACILRGFPGVGKSVLVAELVELNAARFAGVCWLHCREREATADVIFARLDAFLQAAGDASLQALLRVTDEAKRLDQLIAASVRSLSRVPYLVVLDDVGAQLGPAADDRYATLTRLLLKFAAVGRQTKMILISDRRLAPVDDVGAAPAGTVIEREIFGLPADAVRQLMKECGTLVDRATSDAVAAQLSGNPTAIRMLCALAIQHYLDPLAALGRMVDPKAPFASLLRRAVADLDDSATSILRRMSLLRRPVGWDRLPSFGVERAEVVALLDRSLLRLEPTSSALTVPELVRRFMRHGMTPAAANAEHAQLAAGYATWIAERLHHDFDRARLLLELAFHHFASGDRLAGASAALPAVVALVTWNHANLAEDGIADVLAAGPDDRTRAEMIYQRGRIADQRGQLETARTAFSEAMALTSDGGLQARCLFYTGRIDAARGDVAAGERLLRQSIDLSRGADVATPIAPALLALAWVAKESGADPDATLAAFEEALAEATQEEDLASASDAHRQLGFLGWTFAKRRGFDPSTKDAERERARSHYARALRLTRAGSLRQQQAAIASELGYLTAEWGRPDDAVRHCVRAIRIALTVGDDFLLPSIYVNLGLAYGLLDAGEAARAWLAAATRLFRRNRNPGGEAYARHELGRLLISKGQTVEARDELAKAVKLCRSNGLVEQLSSIAATLDTIPT